MRVAFGLDHLTEPRGGRAVLIASGAAEYAYTSVQFGILFEHPFVYTGSMSSEDQTLSAALHGEALLLAGARELNALIAQLEALANGHDDTRVECAGNMAGAWFAAPETGDAHALIAAGLLLLAGPVDDDMLVNAVQAGYEGAGGAV